MLCDILSRKASASFHAWMQKKNNNVDLAGINPYVIAFTRLSSGMSWPDLVARKISAERQVTADSTIAYRTYSYKFFEIFVKPFCFTKERLKVKKVLMNTFFCHPKVEVYNLSVQKSHGEKCSQPSYFRQYPRFLLSCYWEVYCYDCLCCCYWKVCNKSTAAKFAAIEPGWKVCFYVTYLKLVSISDCKTTCVARRFFFR